MLYFKSIRYLESLKRKTRTLRRHVSTISMSERKEYFQHLLISHKVLDLFSYLVSFTSG